MDMNYRPPKLLNTPQSRDTGGHGGTGSHSPEEKISRDSAQSFHI